MSVLVAYHFGPIGPADQFLAGFRVVSFNYGSTEEAHWKEVRAMAAAIPPGASVTASETLVPHVAQRQYLQTDYYFVLRQEIPEYAAQLPEVFSGHVYTAVRFGEHAVLYSRVSRR